MLDIICQIFIGIFGISALILLARDNRWGFVLGLAAQPFWYITTCTHAQWGIFFLSLIYTTIWSYGIYKHFFKKKQRKS